MSLEHLQHLSGVQSLQTRFHGHGVSSRVRGQQADGGVRIIRREPLLWLLRRWLMRLFSLQAYELSTLTGTQVLLLVASETGHVYTFATRKLQPMITSETGKALIQTCLNSPDSPPRSDPSSDQRMSATGFEETDLTYQVSEADGCTEVAKVTRQRHSFQGLLAARVAVGVCGC